MNIESVLNSIKNNNISSNYLLFGEENFFIDKIANSFIENIIPDSEKIFNQKILYGKETNVFSLISMLKSFPMVGERQLIVLKEAQKLSAISELSNYFHNPVNSTVFIICYKNKTIDKRKKWIKLFQKNGVLLESKILYGQKVSRWIHFNLSDKNIRIEKSAELLLIDFLGNDLSKITNAIHKLSSIIKKDLITVSDVQKHIGVHREYNTFELQNALAEKNKKKVISIVNYFVTNPNKFPLPPIIGLLFAFFSKLLVIHSMDTKVDKLIADKIKVHPFFINTYKIGCNHYGFQDCVKIISLLKEADLYFKGINGLVNKNYLRELALKIIYIDNC